MIDALKHLKDEKDKLNIIHQTGKLDFETVKKGYVENDWNGADIREYITDMVSQFEKTDLILSRAGATTCAEVAAAGKVAIMIPLPTAADDHQRKNAEALQNNGAAKMILQKDLNGESLANEIKAFINSPEKITEMEHNAKKMAKADAAEVTVDLIKQLAVSGK
jgi:UDP-N-acetylglucosamine--N-acetylmuramyl-(pentapeptide) pyrophosphoryl-undecaprenol N-acetylglucosamine transferase